MAHAHAHPRHRLRRSPLAQRELLERRHVIGLVEHDRAVLRYAAFAGRTIAKNSLNGSDPSSSFSTPTVYTPFAS